MSTTYAVLIGIETYQKQGISSVQFAQADAAAMKDLLVQELGVPAENITVWLDFEATRSVFENDLPYLIRQLAPRDRFIFFYAGHGFFANGTNRLTTWDTHPGNLAGTTVSLEEVLLKPLKDQQGVDSLVFIDACAADLQTSLVQARDIISDLTPGEFEVLVRSTDHSAAFFACSPNQKAYPSDALQHGIWTYHLIQALQGDAEGGLDRDRWITGDSLKNYLAVAVPAYVRENTTIQAEQRPYAILSCNGPFGIHQVPPSDAANPASPVSPATTAGVEAKLTPEQPQTSGNRPQIMLSTVEGHYNQWKGDVFTLHHLGGDAAQYIEIAPINFEGFNKVSLRFEAVPFIGPTKPDAKVHFHVVTGDDGVPNRTFLSFRAAFRTLASPWDTLHPALCRERVRLMSVLLDQRSSLLTLRRRSPVFVRVIHRYYTAVRLLGDVHAGSTALAFSRRPMVRFDHRYLRGLPVLVHEVSRRALGSSTTQDCPGTRAIVPVHVAFRNSVRRQHPDYVFSELNTQPTYPLFMLRLTPHGVRRKTRGRVVR